MIRTAFRAKGEELTSTSSKAKKAVAMNAYRLLDKWSVPPGLDAQGVLSEARLSDWITNVQNAVRESGHYDVAMEIVGHVLTHVPRDPDGLWLHRAAARVLDAKDADPLRAGFRTRLYNSRGVHWVDPTGNVELAIASEYERKASALDGAGFPRIAATVRSLVATYESEARRVQAKAREEF